MNDDGYEEVKRLLNMSRMYGVCGRGYIPTRYISRNELRRELARLIYDIERNRNRPE